MITNQMTAEAEAAAQRYHVLVEAWRSLYRQALGGIGLSSATQINRMIAQSYEIARTYLSTEDTMMLEASTRIAREAQQQTRAQLRVDAAADVSEAASDHLNDMIDYLRSEIAIQVERDIAFMRQSVKRTNLQVTLASRAQNVSIKAAKMQHQLGASGNIEFFFHDRRNQKWPSVKFVRAVWRQHLLAAYNEVAMLEMVEHGVEMAEIVHVSPGSQVNGMRIAMSPNGSLPTYAEVRAEAFHPNSEAIVAVPRS